MSTPTRAVLALVLLSLTPAVVTAAAEPTPVNVLFESRQLDRIDKGSEVTYRFERKVSDEKLLGTAFSDDIKLGVTKVGPNGEREVVFKVFTGDSARDPSNWPDLTINPLFIWYLDRTVGNFSQVAGGSPPYLKGVIRAALADKAQMELIKFKYNGEDVDAYRVTLRPFLGDANSHKMQGYDVTSMSVVVSEKVPGYFLDLTSELASKNAGAPTLTEHISLVGMGEAK